ncbi:MAG: hypothetical protein NT004_11505 [Bacteroidetes bacterium]|nr:hypothetical protein [Bacteroidota bacterium]
MCSQLTGSMSDNQFGIGLGAELLFGELDVFLNYSPRNLFNSGQQQFQWRWNDNNKHIIRQVQAGKIVSQSISTINSPMYGAIITNASTAVRRATGFYTIRDFTQPDWFVELYLNNSLVDFTKADASGMFVFKVPLVYGYTTITLKFYGPNGEERFDQRIMNVPYNFLPTRNFEYRIYSGLVSDSVSSKYGRGEFAYGVARILTVGGGVEYLSSVVSGPVIPFIRASFLPFSKLMLNVLYAYGVGFNGLMNINLPNNVLLEVNYIRYAEGQKAIQYNYREQRKAELSFPVRIKQVGGSLRLGFKQDVYPGFSYNQTELSLAAGYRQFSANFSANGNWVTDRQLYASANMALSYRLKIGLSLRTLGQFNLSTGQFATWRFDAEKTVLKIGFLSFSYERNFSDNSNGLNITFKYNLPFAQTNFSTRVTNDGLFTSEGAMGSLAFGSANGFVDASDGSSVGRGGLTLIPYVDINHNNIFDPDEHIAKGLTVSGNGGRMIFSKKDSIIRIFGLEPFSYFDMELREGDFDNLSWRLKHKTYRILIDPNQFKRVEIPILPMGEITGTVNYAEDSSSRGIGRIQVNIFKINGDKYAQTLSESDGFMSYIGMVPGEYYAQVDSIQLTRIGFSVTPRAIPFTCNPTEEGDVIDGVDFTVRPIVRDTSGGAQSSKGTIVPPAIILSDTLSSGQFVVEISDVSDELDGITIQTRLKNVLDLTALVFTEKGVVKVHITGFTGRQAAEAVLEKVKNLGYPNAVVVRMK